MSQIKGLPQLQSKSKPVAQSTSNYTIDDFKPEPIKDRINKAAEQRYHDRVARGGNSISSDAEMADDWLQAEIKTLKEALIELHKIDPRKHQPIDIEGLTVEQLRYLMNREMSKYD